MAISNKARTWLTKADEVYLQASSGDASQAQFSAAIARSSAGVKRLLFEVRKDGKFRLPSEFICAPALYADTKLARRLYGNIFEE